jgi:hypothetical protein
MVWSSARLYENAGSGSAKLPFLNETENVHSSRALIYFADAVLTYFLSLRKNKIK